MPKIRYKKVNYYYVFQEDCMKKLIMSVAVLTLLVVGAFAQVGPDDKSVEYRNVQVYKVYEHPDAYVVMYYTKGVELGQVTLPTEWFKTGSDKGVLRTLETTDFTPYLLLQYTDGAFSKVIMTMPNDRNNVSWGTMDKGLDVDAGGLGDTLILE